VIDFMKKADKEKILRVVYKNYFVIDNEVDVGSIEGAQMFEGLWLAPVWGCDTLQKLIDDISEIKDLP